MAFVKTTNKWDAANAIINTWIKDPTIYCNHCGIDIGPWIVEESCCENPQIARNIDHLMGCIKQNELSKKELNKNEYGATDDLSMRKAVSIPPRLYFVLDEYFKSHGEKLFADDKDLQGFMKKFPALCSCNKI